MTRDLPRRPPVVEEAVISGRDQLCKALAYGSPILATAIAVTLCVLQDHRLFWSSPNYWERDVLVRVYGVLAVIGSAAGAVLTPGPIVRRVAFVAVYGIFSAVAYFVAFVIGLILFVRIDL